MWLTRKELLTLGRSGTNNTVNLSVKKFSWMKPSILKSEVWNSQGVKRIIKIITETKWKWNKSPTNYMYCLYNTYTYTMCQEKWNRNDIGPNLTKTTNDKVYFVVNNSNKFVESDVLCLIISNVFLCSHKECLLFVPTDCYVSVGFIFLEPPVLTFVPFGCLDLLFFLTVCFYRWYKSCQL